MKAKNAMNFFLGVDAGGTKTEFLLGDDRCELGRVRVGSIKRMRVSEEEAEANLLQALCELTRQSGVAPQQVVCCRIGAAGDRVPVVADWLCEEFHRHVGGRLSLVNDVEIALDAAFPGQRGLIVIAGTGSNLACRGSDGKIMTAGGWGPVLADQGSGYTLGLQGLRRGFLALDQRRPTRLLEVAMKFWNLSTLDELVSYANQVPAPDFTKLAPDFVACADQGDEVAIEVMRHEGENLASMAILLIERLRASASGISFAPPAVAFTGSVLTHAQQVRRAMNEALRKRYPQIELREEPADPSAGALWGARQVYRSTVDSSSSGC